MTSAGRGAKMVLTGVRRRLRDQESDVALDQRLLDILVCPTCRADLEHKGRRHVLVCTGCGLQFPVRDGIPVMLPEEATPSRRR